MESLAARAPPQFMKRLERLYRQKVCDLAELKQATLKLAFSGELTSRLAQLRTAAE